MPIQILMPALSPTMTEGGLTKWLKQEGDVVESGDVLCEIETDKATMEVEAVDEGVLGKILIAEGTESIAVNTPIAVLLEEGESAGDIVAEAVPVTAPVPATVSAEPAPTEAPVAAPVAAPISGARIFASPLAKRLAKQNGLDLSLIAGSGPHGRIVKADIEAAVQSGTGSPVPAVAASGTPAVTAPAAAPVTTSDPIFSLMPEFEATPHSGMRKAIARRLTESARDIPHFNISTDVELDNLLRIRKDLNDREGADYKLSVNDFIVKAVALALKRNPDCNAAYTDEAILKFNRVDISIAVAIEGGLITPVVKDAGSKGMVALSEEVKTLAAKARDGKLQPEEYQGGTFTISNLGMFGVTSFNSIINPPQGGILSVGAGEQRPVVKNGALAIATVMTLTLAVDHRCIDGAPAAALMKDLKAILEDPLQLML